MTPEHELAYSLILGLQAQLVAAQNEIIDLRVELDAAKQPAKGKRGGDADAAR
jgi:hypothetical protein